MRYLVLLALAVAVSLVPVASAGGIQAQVELGSKVFAPGEPVTIAVYAVNRTPEPVTLEFRSAQTADYILDNVYTWSWNKSFPTVITPVQVPADGRVLLHKFEHALWEYPLAPGNHTVRGIVPGFAETEAFFAVAQDDTTTDPDSPWLVTAEAHPPLTPLGTPVEFSLTVRNMGNQPASFGVDGCPVHYEIDGVFQPRWGCAEFWELITLDPGQSRTWTPAEFPLLRHQSRLYPVSTGNHAAKLVVPDIGIPAFARFSVDEPNPDQAYLSGRIVNFAGDGIPEAIVHLQGIRADGSAGDQYQILTGEAGYWFLGGINPGSFRILVTAYNQELWFPGNPDIRRATVVTVRGGEHREELNVTFADDPPPPPPVVRGVVFNESEFGLPVPVEGASVVAVALFPSLTEGDPTQPDFRQPPDYSTVTDELGRFEMTLPPGPYRVLAGRYPDYQYRYSHGTVRWESAPVHELYPGAEEFLDFYLVTDLPDTGPVVTGQVLGFHPFHDGPPEPVRGAVVQAFPILHVPLRGILVTETDENGEYTLPVWPTTPYRVWIHADGYFGAYYRDGQDAHTAQPVDTAPGHTTEEINVVLQPRGQDEGRGVIRGYVMREDPNCSNADCASPVAGALVRVGAAFPTFAPYEITTRSGRDGSFEVRGLTSDRQGTFSYYVSAEVENSERYYYPRGVPFPQAEPLPVFHDQVSETGPIFIGRQHHEDGWLGGRVVNRAGNPVPGARVRAFVDPETSYGRVVTARTDGNGWWFLSGLPHPGAVILAAEAEPLVPGYYGGRNRPTVYRWRQAQPVGTGGALVDILPVEIVLAAPGAGGPFIQAGRVRTAGDFPEPPPPDSTFQTGVAGNTGAADATEFLTPRLRALQYHERNVPRAFFYLVRSETAGPVDWPVAGASTGDNGAVILTGLNAGVYFAYADRPGYETAYFRSAAGGPVPLVLNGSTPAILADIVLEAGDTRPPEPGTPMVTGLVNEPNPFRPHTTIRYRLMENETVTVQLFDFRGRLVRTLLQDTFQLTGPQEIDWNGSDSQGRRVSSGVYFYRVTAGGFSESRKMVLLP